MTTTGQMPPAVARGVIDDDHLADLTMRNVARAQAVIAQMGPRWCCHPANAPRYDKRERKKA